MNKVILATSQFCAPCKTIKQYIEQKSLDIEIKEMENDPQYFKENSIKGVPTLLVDGEKIYGGSNILAYLQKSEPY